MLTILADGVARHRLVSGSAFLGRCMACKGLLDCPALMLAAFLQHCFMGVSTFPSSRFS